MLRIWCFWHLIAQSWKKIFGLSEEFFLHFTPIPFPGQAPASMTHQIFNIDLGTSNLQSHFTYCVRYWSGCAVWYASIWKAVVYCFLAFTASVLMGTQPCVTPRLRWGCFFLWQKGHLWWPNTWNRHHLRRNPPLRHLACLGAWYA